MAWNSPKPKRTLRDFHRRRYGNPLFQRGGVSTSRGRFGGKQGSEGGRRNALIVSGACIGAAALWYVLWGPALAVRNIEVSGTTNPATEATIRAAVEDYADGRALGIFPRRNVIVFSASAARHAVEQKVFLENISIDKRLPSTVVISASEKVPKAVLEREGRLHALDGGGFVIRELADEEMDAMADLPPGIVAVSIPGLGAESVAIAADPAATAPKTDGAEQKPAQRPRNPFPLIIDERTGQGDRPGTQAIPASTVTLILEAYGRLPDIIGDSVRWFSAGDDGRSVVVTVGADWKIHLSTGIPFDAQAERLAIVLKEKIAGREAQLEYVDLRYNERIYFRMKGAAQ